MIKKNNSDITSLRK
jgi:hypothetical protein